MTLVEIIKAKSLDINNVTQTGTDKECVHKFCSMYYDEAFKEFQDKEISLLEIGAWYGGSLVLWAEYFKNAKKIIGLDIVPKSAKINTAKYPNVEVSIADAYSDNVINRLGTYDIIIDDGPHTLCSQMKFVRSYSPKLNKGGMLIVEDIDKYEYVEEFKKCVPAGMTYEVIDIRNATVPWNNVLFIVRNK